MKIATLWAACALTLALSCGSLAFAGISSTHATQSGQTQAQTQNAQSTAGYRDWTTAQMKQLQQALVAHGASIKVTGHWDDATRAAVKAFQKKSGLNPTGFPNQATVKALRKNPQKK